MSFCLLKFQYILFSLLDQNGTQHYRGGPIAVFFIIISRLKCPLHMHCRILFFFFLRFIILVTQIALSFFLILSSSLAIAESPRISIQARFSYHKIPCKFYSNQLLKLQLPCCVYIIFWSYSPQVMSPFIYLLEANIIDRLSAVQGFSKASPTNNTFHLHSNKRSQSQAKYFRSGIIYLLFRKEIPSFTVQPALSLLACYLTVLKFFF